MTREIKKETIGFLRPREVDVIYEDGKKVGHIETETEGIISPKEVRVEYNNDGDKVSETREEPTFLGFGPTEEVTRDTKGEKLYETTHERTFLGFGPTEEVTRDEAGRKLTVAHYEKRIIDGRVKVIEDVRSRHSRGSSSSDSDSGDYSYSSSDDSGSYSSSSSSSTSSSPKKEESSSLAGLLFNVGFMGIAAIVASIVSTINSRKEISAPPVSCQIRQSYHESMFFRSDSGLKPVAPDQAYQGQGSIELHYPLSRTDKGLEAIVTIPADDVELRDITYWGGKVHYQEWRGKIGEKFDKNKDKFLSYDEIAVMYNAMGEELVNLLYQDKILVYNKDIEGGGPHAAPIFFQDTQERAVNKSKLEEIKEDPHKIGKRVFNAYRSNNPD